jgi:hypothetical protein
MYQIVMPADISRSLHHAQQYALTHEVQSNFSTARPFYPPSEKRKHVKNLGDS